MYVVPHPPQVTLPGPGRYEGQRAEEEGGEGVWFSGEGPGQGHHHAHPQQEAGPAGRPTQDQGPDTPTHSLTLTPRLLGEV
jgi:hypothetical protein